MYFDFLKQVFFYNLKNVLFYVEFYCTSLWKLGIFGYCSQPKVSTWVKTDPNATTNKIASLRTDIAEKERRIAQLSNENEKLNKQKMQSTTLLNGLQRENSAKDALVHQAKREIEKLKKELREKDSTLSTMSTKVRYNTQS